MLGLVRRRRLVVLAVVLTVALSVPGVLTTSAQSTPVGAPLEVLVGGRGYISFTGIYPAPRAGEYEMVWAHRNGDDKVAVGRKHLSGQWGRALLKGFHDPNLSWESDLYHLGPVANPEEHLKPGMMSCGWMRLGEQSVAACPIGGSVSSSYSPESVKASWFVLWLASAQDRESDREQASFTKHVLPKLKGIIPMIEPGVGAKHFDENVFVDAGAELQQVVAELVVCGGAGRWLETEEVSWRHAAVFAYVQCEKTADWRNGLLRLVRDDSPQVRGNAAIALARSAAVEDADVKEALEGYARSDLEDQKTAEAVRQLLELKPYLHSNPPQKIR